MEGERGSSAAPDGYSCWFRPPCIADWGQGSFSALQQAVLSSKGVSARPSEAWEVLGVLLTNGGMFGAELRCDFCISLPSGEKNRGAISLSAAHQALGGQKTILAFFLSFEGAVMSPLGDKTFRKPARLKTRRFRANPDFLAEKQGFRRVALYWPGRICRNLGQKIITCACQQF